MKAIFTLLLATVFTSAFAYDEGKITVTVASGKNLQVYIDGRAYQDDDNSFVLNNVKPGNHTIKVYKLTNNSNGGYGKNRNDRNNRNQLLYSSTVYVRPSYHVDVMINRFGKALVDEKALADRNGNWDDDDWNDGYNNNGDYNQGGYNNGYQAISNHDFNQLMQKIRNQWLGKMSTTRDAVNNNYFNVSQMRQLLQIFSSESDKLELAKLSYKNIVDRQNFRQLYELFNYQSQADLDKYVRDSRF